MKRIAWSWQNIGIVFWVLIVGVNLFVYAARTRQYPQWDEHHYLTIGAAVSEWLHNPKSRWAASVLEESRWRQPLYGWMLTPLYFVIPDGFRYESALMLNAVLFAGTVLAVYAISRRMMEKTESFFAAVVFGSLGNALFYSHFTYSETAVSFFCAWALYWLLRSNGFVYRRDAVLAGVFLGAGWLVRWVAPVFLVGPIVIAGFAGIWEVNRRRQNGKNLLVTMCLFLLFAVLLPLTLYYIPNAGPFLDYVHRNQDQGVQWVKQYRDVELADTLSTKSFMYYFNILSQNTVWVFFLFVVGSLAAMIRIRKFSSVLAFFYGSYLFFTTVTIWKEDRFIVPMYPAFAVLCAAPFTFIRKSWLKTIGIAVASCLVVCIGIGGLWGVGPFGKRGLTDVVLPSFIHHPRRIYLTPMVWPPTKEYVRARAIVDAILADHGPIRPVVKLIYPHEPLSNGIMSIATYERPGAFMFTAATVSAQLSEASMSGVTADYVIMQKPAESEWEWKLVTRVFIPSDSSEAYVYRTFGKEGSK